MLSLLIRFSSSARWLSGQPAPSSWTPSCLCLVRGDALFRIILDWRRRGSSFSLLFRLPFLVQFDHFLEPLIIQMPLYQLVIQIAPWNLWVGRQRVDVLEHLWVHRLHRVLALVSPSTRRPLWISCQLLDFRLQFFEHSALIQSCALNALTFIIFIIFKT